MFGWSIVTVEGIDGMSEKRDRGRPKKYIFDDMGIDKPPEVIAKSLFHKDRKRGRNEKRKR